MPTLPSFTRHIQRFRDLLLLLIFSLLCLICANPPEVQAQSNPLSLAQTDSLVQHLKHLQEQSDKPLKLGLALSGGGAKGFAHIGVLKVLEEAGLSFDYIAGTSAGSMVGGLYAIGYSAKDLEEISSKTDWTEVFSERSGRRYLANPDKLEDAKYILNLPINKSGISLPEGVITGQNLMELLTKLTWSAHTITDFSELPIPFRCVATDLATGDPVVLDSGYLPYAMRASIAIPSIFTPFKLNGKELVDGGLSRNLPVSDARQMGADFVLAVDVSSNLQDPDSLNTFLDVMNQTFSMKVIQNKKPQVELADMMIRPNLNNYSAGSFNKVEELIALGEKEARKYLPELKQLAQLFNPTGNQVAHKKPPTVEQIYINDLEINGLNNVSREFVTKQLGFELPSTVKQQDIQTGIRRLYSSQFFELVTYKIIDHQSEGSTLLIDVVEQDNDVFRLGFRYDTFTQSSLLLHTTFRNLLSRGSVLRTTARLGDIVNFNIDYIYYFGSLDPGFGSRFQADFYRNTYPLYQDNEEIARTDLFNYSLDLFLGDIFSKSVITGIGAQQNWVNYRNTVNPEFFPDKNRSYYDIYGLFWLDTFDRGNFPTRGQSFLAKGTYAGPLITQKVNFAKVSASWSSAIHVHDRVTIQTELYGAVSTGDDIPLIEKFYLKYQRPQLGYIDFAGVEPKSISGEAIQKAGLTLQLEPFDKRFIALTGNMGNAFDRFPINPLNEKYIRALELTVGALTPVGPLRLSLATSTRNKFMAELNLGYRF
jgi:NTE family protein